MGTLVRRRAPATERELAAADKALGLPIPETYRSFLAVTNGGQPVQSHFSEMVGVQEFFEVADALKNRRAMQGRISAEMLPIAQAEGGNLILLDVMRDVGAVYFWDHELEGTSSTQNKLASSFDDFVSKLTSGPGLSGPRPKVVSVKVRNPDVLRELIRRDQETKHAPTIEWPPPN